MINASRNCKNNKSGSTSNKNLKIVKNQNSKKLWKWRLTKKTDFGKANEKKIVLYIYL